TFELHHDVDDGAIVRTSLIVRSSDIENMPPLDCWVTSQPYPLDVADGLVPALVFNHGALYDTRFGDAFDMRNPVVKTGYLRAPLRKVSKDDAMQFGVVIGDGTLLQVLMSTTIAPEGFSRDVTISGALMRVAL